MFDLIIKEVILQRSWKPTNYFLTKFGMTISTARALMTNKAKVIKLKTLYDLCLALNCTPNDLLDISDKQMKQIPPNHPLRSLKKSTTKQLPTEFLKTMSHEKLEEANALLKKLWEESHQVSEENKKV